MKYKQKPKPRATPTEIEAMFVAQQGFLKAADEFGERADRLKQQLKVEIQEQGVADDKGSRLFGFDSEVAGFRTLKAEKRVQSVLDQGVAEQILKDRGLLEGCQRTITVLDEDALLALIFKGTVTPEEKAAMYSERVTWAFIPLKKELFHEPGD